METVFGNKWFEKHQSKLLWLLNFPVIKYWFRWVMRIHGDISPRADVYKIAPTHFIIKLGSWKGRDYFKADFRTHAKFSKRLYYAFKPVWWAMHAWDYAFADRFVPALSFGFDTLTVNPATGTGGTSVDGYMTDSKTVAQGGFSAARGSTNADEDLNETATDSYIGWAGLSGVEYFIRRAFYHFPTSALTSSAIVTAAVLSVCSVTSTVDDVNTTTEDVVASSAASDNALVSTDFDNVGSTIFATFALASWPATNSYADWTLDANGRANLNKTGVSKYAILNSRDSGNSAPTGQNRCQGYFADQTGTSKDPKLVVTYTIPSTLPYPVIKGQAPNRASTY